MSKVAIIIPAYNAEKTVERTIINVLGQTLRDIEVWVTDDGSTDGTGAILDRLANEDSRVHVIHQANCGAYQARLNALKQIKTPYFGFVDADDTIKPEMYEKMLAVLERENLDAVQCGYKIGSRVEHVGGGKNNHVEHAEHVEGNSVSVLEGEDLTKYKFGYLVNPRVACFIWDKLYRNQYDFDSFELTDKVTNFDDMIFNLQFFRKIERFGLLDEALYNYSQTEGSAVHSYGPRQKHDFKWMVKTHYRLTKELFAKGEYGALRLWFGHVQWYFINLKGALISQVRSWLAR